MNCCYWLPVARPRSLPAARCCPRTSALHCRAVSHVEGVRVLVVASTSSQGCCWRAGRKNCLPRQRVLIHIPGVHLDAVDWPPDMDIYSHSILHVTDWITVGIGPTQAVRLLHLVMECAQVVKQVAGALAGGVATFVTGEVWMRSVTQARRNVGGTGMQHTDQRSLSFSSWVLVVV